METTHQHLDAEKVESTNKSLYKIGGTAALIAAAFALLQIIGVGFLQIEVPITVLGWFLLLQSQPLLGLTELTMFQIPAFILCVPAFLALYASLRQANRAYVLVATALAFLGIAVYLLWALAHESHAISMAVDEVLFGIRRWRITQFGSTMVLCERPTSFA